MEGTCESKLESPSAGVYELPGEPAVVINGVPDIPPVDGNKTIQANSLADVKKNKKLKNSSVTEKPKNTGFGGWLEEREVQKLFDRKYYWGTVTEFDQETGWYRVVYEDGDFEDLEWHELQEVLQPLDITMPLKSLALKILRKTQKSEPGTETNVVPDRKSGRRGRPRAALQRAKEKLVMSTGLGLSPKFNLENDCLES